MHHNIECYDIVKVGVDILDYVLLGQKIRKQRKNKGYTLEQLAEKLDVSTTFIGQIERARGVPSLETFVRIANELEISTDALLFGNLNEKSGNEHFIGRIIELTEGFSVKERELLINNIEILLKFKNGDNNTDY